MTRRTKGSKQSTTGATTSQDGSHNGSHDRPHSTATANPGDNTSHDHSARPESTATAIVHCDLKEQLHFTDADVRYHERMKFPLDFVIKTGTRRISDYEARNDGWGFTQAGSNNGIVFCYYDLHTIPRDLKLERKTSRLRRDDPGDGPKYLSPYGDRRRLYMPLGAEELFLRQQQLLSGPKTAIVLVEAEKSAWAVYLWALRNNVNMVPLALGGCWGWKGEPLGLDYCNNHKVFTLLDTKKNSNYRVGYANEMLLREIVGTQFKRLGLHSAAD